MLKMKCSEVYAELEKLIARKNELVSEYIKTKDSKRIKKLENDIVELRERIEELTLVIKRRVEFYNQFETEFIAGEKHFEIKQFDKERGEYNIIFVPRKVVRDIFEWLQEIGYFELFKEWKHEKLIKERAKI